MEDMYICIYMYIYIYSMFIYYYCLPIDTKTVTEYQTCSNTRNGFFGSLITHWRSALARCLPGACSRAKEHFPGVGTKNMYCVFGYVWYSFSVSVSIRR